MNVVNDRHKQYFHREKKSFRFYFIVRTTAAIPTTHNGTKPLMSLPDIFTNLETTNLQIFRETEIAYLFLCTGM